MLKPKDERLHVRTDEDELRRIKKAAEIVKLPTSDFIRKAIDKEVNRLARRYPELQREAVY